jgi:hypothetical protein
MKTQPKFFQLALTSILLLSLTSLAGQNASALTSGVPDVKTTSLTVDNDLQAGFQNALSYPADPTADIPWSSGTNGVADIQAAFNQARMVENSQLGTSIPMLTLPSQAEWNVMSDGQKALWLINRERIDRGVAPLHDLETNVGGVAQYYADYLLDHNTWGHTADGRDPWKRLSDNPAIGACHDFLSVSENLAVYVTSGSSIALPIEKSIHMWMYEDGSCCGWGHRHAILWYPYNDNSGPLGREGFLGIGRANGGPYKGPFSQSWPFAEIIVMNVFDPCATWAYSDSPGAATLVSPSGGITNTAPTYTWNNVNAATRYYLWVSRVNSDGSLTTIHNNWYESAVACSGATCSITPVGVTLSTGQYRWWIQTWNENGSGPWSSPMNFGVGAPGMAGLVSPNGAITDNTPTFSWNSVTTATWYYLWVSKVNGDGSLTTVHTKWYTSVDACTGGACSVTPAGLTLTGGSNYRWWIQTWNDGGYGPWSSAMNFSLPVIPPPGVATLVLPSGAITDTTPTYTWNNVNAATWYYLWVNNAAGTPVIQQWYTAAQVCGNSTCSVTPGITLPSGNYSWWIQTWDDSGYGPWSSAMSFSLPVIPPPGAATLVSPSGGVSDTTPAYSWNQLNDSTWYFLWVSRVNSNGSLTTIHTKWYTSAEACSGATCSITPAGITLTSGNYRWWIQTWNDGGYGPWTSGVNFTILP